MFRKFLYGLMALVILIPLFAQPESVSAKKSEAPLLGRTITVTTTKDDIRKNGNCTLREAVQAANTDKAVDKCPAGSGTDTIVLKKGTYVLSIKGRFEHSNLKGDLDVTNSVRITGAGSSTVIDAKYLDRIFDFRSTSATYKLDNMLLKNGLLAPIEQQRRDDGGAVYNKGSLSISKVRFHDNRVEGIMDERGGAIFNGNRMKIVESFFVGNSSESSGGAIANAATLEVQKTTFERNQAIVGGAFYSVGPNSATTFYDVRFLANTNGPGAGTAIYMNGGGKVYIKGALFQENEQTDENVVENVSGELTIRNAQFIDNEGGSGGIVESSVGKLSVSYSTFDYNKMMPQSGAILVKGGTAVIDRVTLSNNLSQALWIEGGSTKVANSTLTRNEDGACSGAVCVEGGAISFESVTIAGNQSEGSGSLVVLGGAVKIHNTIIANTRNASEAPVRDCTVQPGTTTSLGYNLIGNSEGCGLTAGSGDQFGIAMTAIDAKLVPLANNGGATQTMALQPGSPAVDKADPANTVKTDQRVYQRPAGPRSDIGAFELGASPASLSASEVDPEAELEPPLMEEFPFEEDFYTPEDDIEAQEELAE